MSERKNGWHVCQKCPVVSEMKLVNSTLLHQSKHWPGMWTLCLRHWTRIVLHWHLAVFLDLFVIPLPVCIYYPLMSAWKVCYLNVLSWLISIAITVDQRKIVMCVVMLIWMTYFTLFMIIQTMKSVSGQGDMGKWIHNNLGNYITFEFPKVKLKYSEFYILIDQHFIKPTFINQCSRKQDGPKGCSWLYQQNVTYRKTNFRFNSNWLIIFACF